MSITDIAKKILPSDAVVKLTRLRRNAARNRILRLPIFSEKTFTKILSEDLTLETGDTVYVGSSVDHLNLDFPFYRILPLIQQVIGPKGNVLFPTYPNRSPMSSYEYLQQGNVFDIRRSPSYTGLLSEFARRQKGAIRSLHPTKSVCVIGPDAADLTSEHHKSPYPYDDASPYRKLVDHNAKIIGVGVWTEYLSFVYTIDDAMKENPPVQTYHPEKLVGKCIDNSGKSRTVQTYAHDMKKVIHDVPEFMNHHIAPEICSDLLIKGQRFFRADTRRLFEEMMWLAKIGVTVYPRHLYSREFQRSLDVA